MSTIPQSTPPASPSPDQSANPHAGDEAAPGPAIRRWWRVMDTTVGIIPVPVYVLLVILLIAFTATGGIGKELAMVIAIATVFAFTLGEVGNRIPGLRAVGGGALVVTFAPSLLAHLGWIPAEMTASVGDFFKSSKILNLFIAAVIVGSIVSMARDVLVKGFLKIFVPLLVGSTLALAVGLLAGLAVGKPVHDTFFFTIVPIMAGGVGEGAVPLTVGYTQIAGGQQGEVLASVLPPIMVGNLTAVAVAGLLARLGRRRPHLTGNGVLQPGGEDLADAHAPAGPTTIRSFAGAVLLAVALYLVGVLCAELLGWPAPVVMLFLAVLMTLFHLVTPSIKAGAGVMYDGALKMLAFPVLFIFSLVQTPWSALVKGFAPANLVVIVATVLGMVVGGYVGARLVRLYPVDTAIVAATHSGMGGAGDIAILTAANRMQLMPFAQIATRIGGGITVAGALILYGTLH